MELEKQELATLEQVLPEQVRQGQLEMKPELASVPNFVRLALASPDRLSLLPQLVFV